MSLVPCPSCNRHIRTGEHACPFCGSAISASIAAKVIPGATQRLSRAAAFAFTATLAMTNCGPGTTPPPAADAAADADGGVAPLYGAPADATPDTAPTPDATADAARDDGGPVPLYGAPADVTVPQDNGPGDGGVAPLYGAPTDVGPTPDVQDRDNGGVAPLYGAVPAPDAGDDAGDGSIGVRYGAPPRDA